jgi:lysophospholipase L1-like esterase
MYKKALILTITVWTIFSILYINQVQARQPNIISNNTSKVSQTYKKYKIATFGDSITDGNGTGAWRPAFCDIFGKENIELIGDRNSGEIIECGNDTFSKSGNVVGDGTKEGSLGIRRKVGSDVAYKMDYWMEKYEFDIMTIHVGINDIYNLTTFGTVGDVKASINIDNLMKNIFSKNKDMQIYLAAIVPVINARNETIYFNQKIRETVSTYKSQGYNINLVDMDQVVWQDNDYFDPVHPNANGNKKMAEKFAEVILANTKDIKIK